MKEVMNLTYASSITDLCSINSSFDSAVLRIAYAGMNRNGSFISKDSFEKCMKTIYNCPIVCNYDRDSDTLGGHDVEVVSTSDGDIRLVNMTHPVGVIPEGSKIFWETVTEDDGTEHEYLCAEALLWKRQEAYRKIKEDGICAQSMEITVKSGEVVDNIYHINEFEFTAFALIGVEPCFESASLAFSKENFKQQLTEMMHEIKEQFTKVNSSKEVDNISLQENLTEGGEKVLDKKELLEKYNIKEDNLDFSIEDFTIEELEEKFKAMASDDGVVEESKEETEGSFALTNNIVEEIRSALYVEKIEREWGECSRYCYVDCDIDASEVYCWDSNDWLLYGFAYTMNGDKVEIDFESKKRKKYVIADFDEGEQPSPFAEVFEQMVQKINEGVAEVSSMEEKFNAATAEAEAMQAELTELKEFKAETELNAVKAEKESKISEVFSQFEDLNGVEAFEELKEECKEDCMKYELDALEEKCFAIRGRYGMANKKFSVENTAKIKIEKVEENINKPYGGIFEEYGFKLK